MAKKQDDTILDVTEVYSKTETYIEENQKSLTLIIGAIVLIIGGYFGYKKLYVDPLEVEAQSQMFVAERYFEQDSLNLAINGDGNYLGFLDILDEYSVTPSGNLANYYLGICYLKQGNYEEAIEYLSSFDAKDEIVSSVATGAIGDAYMELGETKTATSYYMDAAKESNNDFTAPIYLMKAALGYEEQGNYKKASKIYNNIKNSYPDTKEGLEVEKYLTRANSIANTK
ncbi:TPA: tetratricopeptide repeat protein [Candidatus Poribacteria bacterium]|nr:tetratricopeptide repeat protein [Candidatus Poribacteria bacterium]